MLLIPWLILSCGESTDDQVNKAIISANQYLSRGECQKAIDVLEAAGRQHRNGLYLLALSSGYACRAGHSEIRFFADDIGLTGSPSPLGGFARYSTSSDVGTNPNSPQNKVFDDLQEAIEILLFAGRQSRRENPSRSVRAKEIGERAGDMVAAAFYMHLVQIGRFLKLYGQAVDGDKQRCLLSYDPALNVSIDNNPPAPLAAYFASGATGPECDDTDMSATSALGATGSFDDPRVCLGIVTINNILSLLPQVLDGYTGGDLDDLVGIDTLIAAAVDQLDDSIVGLDQLLEVQSKRLCQQVLLDIRALDPLETALQVYYAVIVETLFQ